MQCDFDSFINRSDTESVKWRRYGPGVLPMWVADMDYKSPPAVIDALQARVQHGIFGYPCEPPDLRGVLVDRLRTRYDWIVAPEDLLFIPGVVRGFHIACHAFGEPGDGVLVQTPNYPPIVHAHAVANLESRAMALTREASGRYVVDMDLMAEKMRDNTRLFLLCSPHNPVGRVFTRDELQQMAELCLREDVIIVSDEIHCELVYPEFPHTPIATISPEVGQRTVTLMAPSKTFNIAGLPFSVAIIQSAELRQRFTRAYAGLVSGIGVLAYTAALAAYQSGQAWLDELICYLQRNRDHVHDFVTEKLPGISMWRPEGTFLAWLDCREAGIRGNAHEFFLDKASVALNDGAHFGQGGEGFVRLNFGCSRGMLDDALERIKGALDGLNA